MASNTAMASSLETQPPPNANEGTSSPRVGENVEASSAASTATTKHRGNNDDNIDRSNATENGKCNMDDVDHGSEKVQVDADENVVSGPSSCPWNHFYSFKADPKTLLVPVAEAGLSPSQHQQQAQQANERTSRQVSEESSSDGPLPKDLMKILQVVAKTGTCPWLPWEDKDVDGNYDHKNKIIQPSQLVAQTALSDAGSFVPELSSSGTLATGAKMSDVNSTHQAQVAPPSMSPAGGSTPLHPQADYWKRENSTSGSSNIGSRSSPFSSSPHGSVRLSGLSQSYSGSGGVAQATQNPPPRKKHRNGLHNSGSGSSRRRSPFGKSASGRISSGGGSTTMTTAVASATSMDNNSSLRKRPIYLIRTSGHSGGYPSAPGSVGSGRTSGSEVEDSTNYEYDSEATSATTNSEISISRKKTHNLSAHSTADQHNPKALLSISSARGQGSGRRKELFDANMRYKSLQMAVRVATGIVLDHFYHNRGGYTLSPAEKRRNESSSREEGGISNEVANGCSSMSSETAVGNKSSMPSSEEIYQQRRQRLLQMLTSPKSQGGMTIFTDEGAPFTVQRIAEVLLAPDRYYTQTHKLCNCLEKLLLVKLSTDAFGGSTGGDTAQSRKEEQELAAFAIAKEREGSRLRQRRLRRRTSSPTDEMLLDGSDANKKMAASPHLKKSDQATSDISSENVGTNKAGEIHTDSQQSSLNGITTSDDVNSTSRELVEAARASLRTKFDHVGIEHHANADRDDRVRAIAENRGLTNSPPPPSLAMSTVSSNLARVPSPILFNSGNSGVNETHLAPTASNMQMLQLHHSMALAGVPVNRTNASPLDLMTIDAATIAQMRSQTNSSAPGSEGGRSSASNSDIDSESDDISFDDSASDRSDGSDTGPISSHHEPFTAARAMALNRMQQQQRLQQSRARTSLTSLHQNEGFRPPADSEYQSGDSIDSTRAEDSEGSDSSDMAD